MGPLWQEIKKGQVYTIDWSAVDGIDSLAYFMDSKRLMQRNCVGHCSSFTIRCDDPHFTQLTQCFGEQSQAGRVNPIVVGDENAQVFVRHKKED